MDKRKKYYLVLDVETTHTMEEPLIYDLGFVITDKQGNIYEKDSFVIEEIFDNKELMDSAYYKKKLPLYYKRLEDGYSTKVRFLKALQLMELQANKYNIDTVCAYNLAFDLRAIAFTSKRLLGSEVRFNSYKRLDIWSLACEVLFSQKTYSSIAIEQKWYSERGNYRTNAEVAHSNITGDYDFEEEHTGLEDSIIEAQILARCLKQKKKYTRGIINRPWQLVTKKHGRIRLN